ncbi:NAD(+) synthase [Nocardia nepalensis]|uniref:NAD(+) synthase n=1 Tax=Nocardia nepalensis TaxID=3375448 RepID=UPI003B67CAC5
MLQASDVDEEVARLIDLIRSGVGDDRGLVFVSGGLDSDVVARLTVRALGVSRVKLLTVVQDDMSPIHLEQARSLAAQLGVELIEIDMRGLHLEVLYRLAAADQQEEFDPLGLLDPARMKCSLRTVLTSTYQDRGYVVIGTGNRTESELGFFLPFGDGIWHIGPIAHLYKTEVRLIAAAVGTSESVLGQPPSAGFWIDQTDREDIGFWLVNEGPIQREREFSDDEVTQAGEFSRKLDETALDELLLILSEGGVTGEAPLPPDLIAKVELVVKRSARFKGRPTGVTLSRLSSDSASTI